MLYAIMSYSIKKVKMFMENNRKTIDNKNICSYNNRCAIQKAQKHIIVHTWLCKKCRAEQEVRSEHNYRQQYFT